MESSHEQAIVNRGTPTPEIAEAFVGKLNVKEDQIDSDKLCRWPDRGRNARPVFTRNSFHHQLGELLGLLLLERLFVRLSWKRGSLSCSRVRSGYL